MARHHDAHAHRGYGAQQGILRELSCAREFSYGQRQGEYAPVMDAGACRHRPARRRNPPRSRANFFKVDGGARDR
jgi:hypothetical protein